MAARHRDRHGGIHVVPDDVGDQTADAEDREVEEAGGEGTEPHERFVTTYTLGDDL
jgi:hypothetical protein